MSSVPPPHAPSPQLSYPFFIVVSESCPAVRFLSSLQVSCRSSVAGRSCWLTRLTKLAPGPGRVPVGFDTSFVADLHPRLSRDGCSPDAGPRAVAATGSPELQECPVGRERAFPFLTRKYRWWHERLCWVGGWSGVGVGLQKWCSQEMVGPGPGSGAGRGETVHLLDVFL